MCEAVDLKGGSHFFYSCGGKESSKIDEKLSYKILQVYKISSQDRKTATGPYKTKVQDKSQRSCCNCDLHQIRFTDSGQNVKTFFM